MSMTRRLRAIGIVGMIWAGAWVLAGMGIVTWRLHGHFWERGGEEVLRYYLFWARLVAPCGFVAGATFAASMAAFPPLAGGRLSRRWAMAYGLAGGLASSAYLLLGGNAPAIVPLFAEIFGITGVVTAIGTVAIARRASAPPLPPVADARQIAT